MASASAATALADFAEKIPNTGLSLASMVMGDNDIAVFGQKLADFGPNFASYADSIKNINADKVTASANAATALAYLADNIPNTEGFINWILGKTDLRDFGKQLVVFGDAMDEYSDAVDDIDCEAVKASAEAAWYLGDTLYYAPKDSDHFEDYGENIAEFAYEFEDACYALANVDPDGVYSAMDALYDLVINVEKVESVDADSISDVAGSLGTLRNEIHACKKWLTADSFDGLVTAFEDLGSASMESITEKINAGTEDIKGAGVDMMENLVAGAESYKTDAKAAFSSIVTTCVTAISSMASRFATAGANLAKGFASGISANAFLAEARARSMAAAAARAAEDELDVHSPSRVGYEIGAYFGLGFVNGINSYVDRASRVGSEVADSARNGLSQVIGKIADVINSDIDTQPTIRPVLDLTDIRAGAGAMGNMLNLRPSVGTLSDVGSISMMMNRRVQNGNVSDILSAMDKLGKDLKDLERTSYNINGVTYDDGTNLADAVRTIIRTARIERRV